MSKKKRMTAMLMILIAGMAAMTSNLNAEDAAAKADDAAVKADDATANAELTALLEKNTMVSLEEALPKIAPVLNNAEIFAPTRKDVPAKEGAIAFQTAKDRSGKDWFYIFTNTTELLKVLPPNTTFAALSFSEFLQMIESQPNLGGIYINSKSLSAFPIPASVFSEFKKADNS